MRGDSQPTNRSRKRFRFPAPLGSGPFRGPFFCAAADRTAQGDRATLQQSKSICWPCVYKEAMPPSAPPPGAERLLRWIMVGIVVWGAFHAFGAWTLNHDARRPLVVLGCVAAFLGFWLAMLSTLRTTARRDRRG